MMRSWRRQAPAHFHCPGTFEKRPIILLDEATASLDAENETDIQQAISQLVKQNGTFARMVRLQNESQNWTLT